MKENISLEMSFEFALDIIRLYKQLHQKQEYVLSKQILRSGTSIGANVEEAQAAQSRKDFIAKMYIATKEARETRYWLRLLEESKLVDLDYTIIIGKINHLINILTKITKTTNHRTFE